MKRRVRCYAKTHDIRYSEALRMFRSYELPECAQCPVAEREGKESCEKDVRFPVAGKPTGRIYNV